MSEQHEQPITKIYNDPISVAKRTKQRLYYVEDHDKASMLTRIIKSQDVKNAVVITKTKRDADKLSVLLKAQDIAAAAIHGNKRAQENETAVNLFKEGKLDILIATDMILQSLRLSDISYMLSHDLPYDPKHYLSRLGCLSETGEATALLSMDQERERFEIERVMRQEIPEEELEGFVPTPASNSTSKHTKDKKTPPRHRKLARKRGKDPAQG